MTDFTKICKDPSINVIIEVMGGIEPARDYISRSLKTGKSVVTANKALISSCWDELHAIAEHSGSYLFLEARLAYAFPLLGLFSISLRVTKYLASLESSTARLIISSPR